MPDKSLLWIIDDDRSIRWVLEKALEKAGGNKAKAARLLGVGRATIYRFLGQHPEILVE